MKINPLRFSETQILNILYKIPSATAIYGDQDFTIDAANDAMLNIWGRNQDVIGMPLAEAIPEIVDQPFLALLKNVWQTGKVYEGTNTPASLVINGVRTVRFVDFTFRPLLNDDGQVYCIMNTAVDVTERYQKLLSNAKTEEILRFSIAAANVGLWHLDVETKRLTVSERWKELFEFSPQDDVTLESAFAQLPEDYQQRIRSEVDKALATSGNYDVEHPITNAVGERIRWVRAIGRVSSVGPEGHTHMSGVIIDITDQKMQDVRKNDFISMVSHELKTPLTSLSGYAEILLSKMSEYNDGFTAGALAKMNHQIKKMSNLINGFLTLSRLEAGNKLYVEKTVFNIDKLIREVIDDQKLISANLLIHLDDCDEIEVYADRMKIGAVLENLLSNANKYSPMDKNIVLTCAVKEKRVRISVADNGIGVSKKDIGKLFQRYYRVDGDRSNSSSGFGLGLYLSSEIIAAHDGAIWVTSDEGKGSTFYFELPLGAPLSAGLHS